MFAKLLLSIINFYTGRAMTDENSISKKDDAASMQAIPDITFPEITFYESEENLPVKGKECFSPGLGDNKIPVGLLLSVLIPVSVNAANTASQYGSAIVQFPPGKGWSDLIDRKSIGEGWKMLNVSGKGKAFGAQGAIKQAGLAAPAVANIALQSAAVIVGIAYMNEISNRLDRLESSVQEIQIVMERERTSVLIGAYETLKRYSLRYEEYASSPIKLTAARSEIESIMRDLENAWAFQSGTMNSLTKKISDTKRPTKELLQGYVD
ncbi:MAG: hypothetical protein LUB61_00770 [Eggerthellaceae bacterium]|nr:hypothetical protein [Eggerthellaceae bacterium]